MYCKLLFISMFVTSSIIARSQQSTGVVIEVTNAYNIISSTDLNNDFTISYIAYDDSLTQSTVNLLKVNSSGNFIYHKTLSVQSYSGMDFTTTTDGGLGIFSVIGQQDFNLMRLDAAGNILWQKNFNVPAFNAVYFGNCINAVSDGSFYVTLSEYGFSGILKIGPNGNLLWSKTITSDPGCGKCPGFRSTVTSDGGVINTLKDENYECITRLDGNGNLVWSKSFNDGMYRWPEFIKTFPNGELLVAGNDSNGGSYFQKLSATGNIIFAKSMMSCEVEGIQPLTDGTFFIAANYNGSLTLMHLNSSGNLIAQKTIGFAEVSYAMKDFFTDGNSSLNFSTFTGDYKPMYWFFDGDLSGFCNTYSALIPISNDVSFSQASIDTSAYVSNLIVNVSAGSEVISNANSVTTLDFCEYVLETQNAISPHHDIMIYPNPTAGQFTVTGTGFDSGYILSIYNSIGQLVDSKKVTGDRTEIAGLPRGLYFISLTEKEIKVTKKLIVE